MTAIISVTREALIKRINRKLKPAGQRIKKNRGSVMLSNFGAYCVFDVPHNCVVERHVDIAAFAAVIGVMGGRESMSTSQAVNPDLAT